MFEMKDAIRSFAIAGWLSASAVLLVSCGGSGPNPQARPVSPEMTGTATYDATVSTGGVTAKGIAGTPRTSANSSGTNQYAVSLQDLTGPYLLSWLGGNNDNPVNLYAIATQPGVANITPLTTLVLAQLTGLPPTAAYAAFGSASGSAPASLFTDTNIQAAQAKVTAYLQNVLGVQVKSGTASFVTSGFEAVAGDPMFDTIQALDTQLAANGTTFTALAAGVAATAHLCIVEKIEISVGAGQQDFCPAAKSATPEDADSSILDYVFTDQANDTLTFKARGDTVLSGQYMTAAGVTYTCQAAACNAVVFGTPAADLTRTVTFTGTELTGSPGSAVLNGTLTGAIPGVALPTLPCDNNKFFVIMADRSVVADCVDTNDPLGQGGTINNLFGVLPARAFYSFVNSSDSGPSRATLGVYMDANESVIGVIVTNSDPNTGAIFTQFYCVYSGCSGVTLGPVTVDTDLGPGYDVLVRNITFANTTLTGMDPNGKPIDTTATLKASVTTVYYSDPDENYFRVFPTLMDCATGADPISITAPSGPFNFCDSPASRGAYQADDGDITLSLGEDNTFGESINVLLHEGAVASVTYQYPPVQEAYSCSSDCTGVTVSKDASGNYTLAFAGAVLHEDLIYQVYGDRTVALSSGPLPLGAPTPTTGMSVPPGTRPSVLKALNVPARRASRMPGPVRQ